MKQEMSLMGIPRQKWAHYIQNALKEYNQKQTKIKKREKSKGSNLMNKIKIIANSKLENLVFRKFKTKNYQLEDINRIFKDQIIKEDQQLFNSLFSEKSVNKKDLGEHGTFIMNRDDKKSYIVDIENDNN